MACALDQLRRSTLQRAFQALNSVVLPAVKTGIASPLPVGLGVVVLETTGRSSGKPRQVPLVAARVGDRVNVSTVRSSSEWVRNLQAEPDASVWISGRKRSVSGTVTPGPLTVATLDVDVA